MEVRHIAVASAGGTRQNHSGVIEGESPSSDILDAISRCAAAMDDEAQLRDELHVLRLSSDPLAHFATSLIDLERARRGDPEARAAVPEVAESLLVFWNDGDGPELAQTHPFLQGLWAAASSLLERFELGRLDEALFDCWKARTDAGRLTVAIEELLPEGNRRVEFARCLYHLELARLMVDSSRAEFARRAGLLSEAYQDSAVADELIGRDPGLEHLWKEVVPYLDEFFEHLEEEAKRRAKPPDETPAVQPDANSSPTDPGFRLEDVLSDAAKGQGSPWPTPEPQDAATISTEKWNVPTPAPVGPPVPYRDPLDFIGEGEPAQGKQPHAFRTLQGKRSSLRQTPPELAAVEALPTEVVPVETPTPEPITVEEAPVAEEPILEAEALGVEEVLEDDGEGELVNSDEFELVEEVEEVGGPPPGTAGRRQTPSSAQPAHEPAPDRATTDFWLHTFQTLELLPGELGRNARILACETRADRKRLSGFIDSLAPHLAVPEARAFACLIGLMLAGQTKEKSLFGQSNPRRAEALAAALPYLQTSVEAAAKATVWFELDGLQTQAALTSGLSLLVEYLAFCNRTQKDPLAARTVEAFTT